jgi:hypothetical protein
VVGRSGSTRVAPAAPATSPPVDCFYVYPTISNQRTVNANLQIGLQETAVAVTQASRFSQDCNVYAPVYRQITLGALDHPSRITLGNARLAYRSVLSAFRNYLAHYNHGRGIVFIGHSQGATILIRLLQQEVDDNAALRKRLVSALVLGGNVTVPKGGTVGGDFAHIPACTSRGDTACVVAYSSFANKPPANSQFGRTTSDAGVPLLATPPSASSSLELRGINPASRAVWRRSIRTCRRFALPPSRPGRRRRCRLRGRIPGRTPAAATRGTRAGLRSRRRPVRKGSLSRHGRNSRRSASTSAT